MRAAPYVAAFFFAFGLAGFGATGASGVLKKGGLLTRDSHVVERKKKYGKAKARRAFQFSKR